MTEEFLLNTGSTIEEGRLAKGGSKLTEDYTEECAVCEMNLEDYLELGSPEKVMVTARTGIASLFMPMRSGGPCRRPCLHAEGHLVECSGGPGDVLHRLASLQGLSGQDRADRREGPDRQKNWL